MFYGRRIEMLEGKVNQIEDTKHELVTTLKLVQAGLEEHKEMFKAHDEKEMEKYDGITQSIKGINKEILKFNKILWVAIGVGIVLNLIGVTAFISNFGQSAIQHEVGHYFYREAPRDRSFDDRARRY